MTRKRKETKIGIKGKKRKEKEEKEEKEENESGREEKLFYLLIQSKFCTKRRICPIILKSSDDNRLILQHVFLV